MPAVPGETAHEVLPVSTTPNDSLDRLHRELGFKRLNPIWAKVEIVLGLFAVAAGLVGGMHFAVKTEGDFSLLPSLGPVMLITLGGYLALAGHRSHLYQSNNRVAAHLADLVRNFTPPASEKSP